MYEQNIPFYIDLFKKCTWSVYESEHYVFHVQKNSLAEHDIESIKNRQESAYEKITTTLGIIRNFQKIKYYFYSTREQKEKLMGDSWFGQTIYNEFTIHAVYNEKDKVVGEHEDTHLLSLEWGLPISLFQEGLAEAMVGSSMFGNAHKDVLNQGFEKGLSINLEELFSQQGWLDTPDEEAEFFYSVAGSFVTHLILVFGREIFKKVYLSMGRQNHCEENIKQFQIITGKTLKNVEAEWLKVTLKT